MHDDEATPFNANLAPSHKLLHTSLGIFPARPVGGVSEAACQLLVKHGKWNALAGHTKEGRMLLYAEEMMYLLAEGSLEVIYDELPLTVAEGFALINETSPANGLVHPPSAFTTYSLLRTHGFIVMRPSLFHTVYVRAPPAAPKPALNQKRKAADDDDDAAASSDLALDPSSLAFASLFYRSACPAPQGKKQRRGAPRPAPRSDESQARIESEVARLKEMQGWLGEIGAPIAHSAAATDASGDAPTASLVASLGAPSTSALHALLSTPCDFFYVWLPLGAASLLANESNFTPRAFKKTEPSIPDYICLCTSPRLTYEALWSVLPHCTRSAIAEFESTRPASSASAAASQPAPPCLADVFSRLYALSDERAALYQSRLAAGSTAPLLHLRIAVCPVQQASRVFFVDAPTLTTPLWTTPHLLPLGNESMLDIGLDDRR